MRNLLLLFLLLAFGSFKGTSPKKFSIKIKEWGFMSKDVTIRVTNDSINGLEMDYKNNEESGFDNGLTSSQTQKIWDALVNVKLDTIGENYVNNSAPDDLAEFDFTITKEDVTKKIHVYETRVDALLQLTKAINVYLPKDMQLHYDEQYLAQGNK